jgi:hypothetical protein
MQTPIAYYPAKSPAAPTLRLADAAMSIRVMRASVPSTPGEERLDIQARRSIVTGLRTFRLLRQQLALKPVRRLP